MISTKRPALAVPILALVFIASGIVLAGGASSPSMTLYNGTDFKGKPTELNIEGVPANSPQSLEGKDAYRRMSSIRWSLPSGKLVIFYSQKDRKGDRLTIWGKGELPNLFDRHFDNDAAYWEWTKIGK